jgi:hypothetical protein
MMSDGGPLPELQDSDDVELMQLEEQLEDHDILKRLRSIDDSDFHEDNNVDTIPVMELNSDDGNSEYYI